MKINFNSHDTFINRHIGSNTSETNEMLKAIGVGSIDQLINQTVPGAIRLQKPLDIPEGKTEYEFLAEFKKLASKNKVFKSYIGQGYYNTITPAVILRNIL